MIYSMMLIVLFQAVIFYTHDRLIKFLSPHLGWEISFYVVFGIIFVCFIPMGIMLFKIVPWSL